MIGVLQALTSFSVTVDYRWRRTVLDVREPGGSGPVARLSKAGPVRARAAYELFAGPGLTQFAGQVSPSGALGTDGAPIGIVNLSGGRVADGDIHPMSGARHTYVVYNPALWRVVQAGLPPFDGRAVGRATRLIFNRLSGLLERVGLDEVTAVPCLLVPLTFGFGDAGSTGFTVTMTPGRPRLEVAVAGSLLDRRLVFACLTALTALIMWTPRGELVDMAAPFRPRPHRR